MYRRQQMEDFIVGGAMCAPAAASVFYAAAITLHQPKAYIDTIQLGIVEPVPLLCPYEQNQRQQVLRGGPESAPQDIRGHQTCIAKEDSRSEVNYQDCLCSTGSLDNLAAADSVKRTNTPKSTAVSRP